MNKANKITMSRIILSVIILIILLFPFHQIGIDMPSYIVNGNITIEIKYIIAGVLFVIASIGVVFVICQFGVNLLRKKKSTLK